IMKQHKKRGLLASLSAVVTTVALALGGAAAAHADTTAQPVPESSPVTITKLEQPDTLGDHATGEQQSTAGFEGVGGVVFDYYLVEDTGVGQSNDIGTNAGQSYAAGLTAETAPVGATPTGGFPATNTPSGVTT